MKKIQIIVTFLATAFLASCGSEDKKIVTDNSPVISVKVSQVANNINNPFLAVSGKIQSEKTATLSTRMMGFVTNTPVNVGDKVSNGQLLIAVNNSDLQAKKVWIYNSQGNAFPKVPVFGTSAIDLANADGDSALEFVTKSDSNSLILYQMY